MSALEQEIFDRVRHLDEDRKQRVLEFILNLDEPQITMSEWLDEAAAFRAKLRAKYGDDYTVGSQSLLEEAREERLNDIMDGTRRLSC